MDVDANTNLDSKGSHKLENMAKPSPTADTENQIDISPAQINREIIPNNVKLKDENNTQINDEINLVNENNNQSSLQQSQSLVNTSELEYSKDEESFNNGSPFGGGIDENKNEEIIVNVSHWEIDKSIMNDSTINEHQEDYKNQVKGTDESLVDQHKVEEGSNKNEDFDSNVNAEIEHKQENIKEKIVTTNKKKRFNKVTKIVALIICILLFSVVLLIFFLL